MGATILWPAATLHRYLLVPTMRRLLRPALRTLAGIYLLLSLPLVLLVVQSSYFRSVTAAEIARKLNHFRLMEAIFCGDSITAGVPNWGLRLRIGPFSTLNLAVPGLAVRQVQPQVVRAIEYHPKSVIVMAGTNDVDDPRMSDDAIVADWETIFRLRRNPATQRLVIISIPFQADCDKDQRIQELNERLKALATSYRWLYVDINSGFLSSRASRKDLFPDGRHFSELAYRHWAAALRRALYGER